jgi:hypothetical protein
MPRAPRNTQLHSSEMCRAHGDHSDAIAAHREATRNPTSRTLNPTDYKAVSDFLMISLLCVLLSLLID